MERLSNQAYRKKPAHENASLDGLNSERFVMVEDGVRLGNHSLRQGRRLVHVVSTALFLLSVGYILVYALREQGTKWWVIFSLSGPSLVFAFLLVSYYLFAIYRGAMRRSLPEIEHPLTSSEFYLLLYDISPFLGCLAGLGAMWGESSPSAYWLGVSYGIFTATFLVWVILDPAISVIETVFPRSREHRRRRLEQLRLEKEQRQQRRQQILRNVQLELKQRRSHWQEQFAEPVRVLAEQMCQVAGGDPEMYRSRGVDIGVMAWQEGGLECMRVVHQMMTGTVSQLSKMGRSVPEIDYLSRWWDGVGAWRQEAFSEVYELA